MKPSPGPWRAHNVATLDSRGAAWADVVVDGDGRIVAEMCSVPGDDAALIAAAPEMRAALLKLEWEGNAEVTSACPVCHHAPQRGHQVGCALAALLERIR